MEKININLQHILDATDELADMSNLLALHSAVKAAQLGELIAHDTPVEHDGTIWEKIITVARDTSRTVRHMSGGDDAPAEEYLAAISESLNALNAAMEKLCVPPSQHKNGRHPAYSPASMTRHITRIAKKADELRELVTTQT